MQKIVTPPDSDEKKLRAVERLLHDGTSVLMNQSGEKVELPRTVSEILTTAIKIIAGGQAVTLIPENQVITTQRAANILGMSRPFFVKLLATGVMPHHRVGNQRRVYLQDVLKYRSARDQERLTALDRLARDANEAGLYDQDRTPNGSDE